MPIKQPSIGVLLVNLGTPTSPATKDVSIYLREFLMDRRVMDIPFLWRWLLVNGVIVPFRAPRSARAYQKLWSDQGSPLLFHGKKLANALQKSLGEDYSVALAMRYQNPSLSAVLAAFKKAYLKQIIVIPLFPQYASASSGSVMEEVMDLVKQWTVMPTITFVRHFFQAPLFIAAWAALGKKYVEQQAFDHVLFSYHGLPERQIKKSAHAHYCHFNKQCCSAYHDKNHACYRAQCFETTRLLATALGIAKEKYTTTFQSRLGRNPWIKPYTDKIIKTLAHNGTKSMLVFSPSFVADCLETTIEVGEELRGIFKKSGGEKWQWVESLNVTTPWVNCLKNLVLSRCI